MKKISAIQKILNYFFMMINVKTLELLVLVVDIDAKVTILGINPDAMLIIAKFDIILTECKIIVLKIYKKEVIFLIIIKEILISMEKQKLFFQRKIKDADVKIKIYNYI